MLPPTLAKTVAALITLWFISAPIVNLMAAEPETEEPKANWILDHEQHCNIWNPAPNVRDGVSWSGKCITQTLPDGTQSGPIADGEGVIRWCNGAKATLIYVGSVKAGHLEGSGTLIYMDGVVRIGQFKADELVSVERSASTTIENRGCIVPSYSEWARHAKSAVNNAPDHPVSAPQGNEPSSSIASTPPNESSEPRAKQLAADASDSTPSERAAIRAGDNDRSAAGKEQRETDTPAKVHAGTIVKLVKSGGVYEVPVLLNNALTIRFVLDSGAAEVSVTPDVFITLVRTGTIGKTDILKEGSYVQANGTTTKNQRFLLRTVQIGDRILRNVQCSVSDNLDGVMLLGQSALEKLGRFSLDYATQTLVLEDSPKPRVQRKPTKP